MINGSLVGLPLNVQHVDVGLHGMETGENTKRHQAHVEICKIESKGKDIGATTAYTDKCKCAQQCAKRYGERGGQSAYFSFFWNRIVGQEGYQLLLFRFFLITCSMLGTYHGSETFNPYGVYYP